jgi:peptidyl-prolyl cis-trans isomerase D
MLTTIREKAQGAFAWLILIVICVPFALWGIQNYMDNGKEPPVASVGDKDFYQRDVNKAYEQYAQNFQGMGVDEQLLKTQALDKLVKDEVLLQYASQEKLVATDASAREFIKTLPYFQTDGKFDDKKFKSLLGSQRMSSNEFVNKIKSALIMEQFQRSIVDSSFVTQQTIDSFFKIQNQQRDIDYMTVPLEKAVMQSDDKQIADYYKNHQEAYKIPEQVSVEYVELLLSDIAKKIDVTDDKLRAFYDEQKGQYTTPERRKISHILVAVDGKTDDKTALAKVTKALEELKAKDFSVVAAEFSDDKGTAKKGGDLGLLVSGGVEKPIEDAAIQLKLGEVSKPVRSSFGYHLVKVSELVPAQVKSFDAVKAELTQSYQKAQAENIFYENTQKLGDISYENPDNLQVVSEKLELEIKKSSLFTKDKGEGIAAEQKIRDMAFSEEVLKGNNSTGVELGADRIVVLRLLERKPSALKDLASVKGEISTAINAENARQQAADKAKQIKQRLVAGEALQKIAADNKLEIKSANVNRTNVVLPPELSDAVFMAAKPLLSKASFFIVPMPSGEQVVVNLKKVTPGVMTDEDKKKFDLAKKNLARAFGQTEFNSLLGTLQAKADITIKSAKSPQ